LQERFSQTKVFVAGLLAGKDKNKIIEHKNMGYIKTWTHLT